MSAIVDTGPLVALFDPKDPDHEACRVALAKLHGRLTTTTPVLTEAFHLLEPDSIGAANLVRFLADRALQIFYLDDASLARAFELMAEFRKQRMDFADAAVVAAAEVLRVRTVFTLDRRDFRVYRARFGHRRAAISIVP